MTPQSRIHRPRVRYQQGHVYEKHGAFHIRYYATIEGKRVQKSEMLHEKDGKHYSIKCPAVQELRQSVLARINSNVAILGNDIFVADFWTVHYLPFIEEHRKASTVGGYKQIWNQHLEDHFNGHTINNYRTHMGSQFLLTLTKTQGQRTLNHIRSLASGIFTHAINIGLLELNPWHNVKILGKIKRAKPTAHYTLGEAEGIISALVDYPDCQLIMALACFMGLRPSEIAGLQWGDVDEGFLHIRRGVVRGNVETTKTPEAMAPLPIPKRVALFISLWKMRTQGEKTDTAWVFPNGEGNPMDPKDIVRRIIRPTVEKAGLKWKSLYAGRRGAGTAIIDLTGNAAAAQELLRHKHMTTTLLHYKKQTESALQRGIDALDAALERKQLKS